MSIRIRIPVPRHSHQDYYSEDDEDIDEDYIDNDDEYENDPDEKMTIAELGHLLIRHIAALFIGFILACLTMILIVPKLPFVEFAVDVNDSDWGADFPEHTLCYITYGIPVISDSVEFGQYIAYQDGADINVAVVTAISDDGEFTVADARGNETTINGMQYLGTVTFTIPWLGRFVKRGKI